MSSPSSVSTPLIARLYDSQGGWGNVARAVAKAFQSRAATNGSSMWRRPSLTLRGSYTAMRMKLKVDGDGDKQIQVMPLVWSSNKARVVGVSEARIEVGPVRNLERIRQCDRGRICRRW